MKLTEWWKEQVRGKEPVVRQGLVDSEIQVLLRTLLFACRFRGPDLIQYVKQGWRLTGASLQPFLLEFSEMHRVGDQGSEDTRFGNCRSVFRVYFMLLDISYLRVGFFLGGGLGRADHGFFFSSILDSFFVCDELKPSC